MAESNPNLQFGRVGAGRRLARYCIERSRCRKVATDYLVDQGQVLIIDVNKKYGPWLVKSDRLYEAMNTLDSTSHKKRGLPLIELTELASNRFIPS
jgi:hypothetical protein